MHGAPSLFRLPEIPATIAANRLHRITPTPIVGGKLLCREASQVNGASATHVRVQLSVRYLVL
jgi:hypothetical protein